MAQTHVIRLARKFGYLTLSLVTPLACAKLLSTQEQSLASGKLNSHITSDSPSFNCSTLMQRSTSIVNPDDYFNASTDPQLIQAQTSDCLRAALHFFDMGASFTRPITFVRRQARGLYQLPQVFRSGTCVISMDVVRDTDQDKFAPRLAHKSALDLAMECVGGFSHVGKKTFIGPRKLVYVMVFGRNPPSTPSDVALIQAATNKTRDSTLELA